MDRYIKSGGAASPPTPDAGATNDYPQPGDPQSATPASVPGPYWFHMISEELRAVITAAGITPDHTDLTQVSAAVQALIGVRVPNDNLLINPAFTINQRVYVSAAVLAAGVYGHDRWKAGASGGDYSFTQLESSTTITIAAGKTLIQVVEDKNVRGGTYTLSWTGTAQARVGVDSATPSGAYAASPLTITGQTAGAVMSVEFNAGTLGEVKLEEGSYATAFVPRSFAQELALCQRYYEKSYDLTTAPGTITDAGAFSDYGSDSVAGGHVSMSFAVRKRAAPTMTMYSPSNGAAGYMDSNGVVISNSFALVSERGCATVGNNGIVAGKQFTYQFVAEAEL